MLGEAFRMESSSVEAFQKMANDWVTTAVRVSAGLAGNYNRILIAWCDVILYSFFNRK